MMRYDEIMSGLTSLGRGSLHDFIVRSNDVNDAIKRTTEAINHYHKTLL